MLHQTGRGGAQEAVAAYQALKKDCPDLDVETREFIDDMGAAYERAMLAVCRAGATSVAELVSTGTPSILIPYPHASGDHQTANARALEQAGAAVLVPDDGGIATALTKALQGLLRDPAGLDSMTRKAAGLGKPGAAARVMDVVRQVIHTRRKKGT